jgi:hypothetical protein
MSDDAQYHRTFVRFSQPESTKPKFSAWDKLTSSAVTIEERREAYPRKVGAFYAFQYMDGRLGQVRLMPKPDQKFMLYATKWEWTYAPPALVPKPYGRCQPVVDEKLTVVGYIGRWWATEVLIPKIRSADPQLQKMIDEDVPVFANSDNPMPSYYHTNDFAGSTSGSWSLLTSVDGAVLKVLGSEGEKAAEPTLFPWEYVGLVIAGIELGFTGVALARTSAQCSIRVVLKVGGRARRLLASGINRGAAEATKAAVEESGTIVSKSVGSFNTPGHLRARVDLEKGKIVYHIDSIHLKAGGNVAEMEARAAHLELMERAALEAQKRGQATFTLRGVAAGENFQTRFKQLAERIGVKRSARTFPGSTGMDNFEVQLTASKVLTWVKQSLAKLKIKAPSP